MENLVEMHDSKVERALRDGPALVPLDIRDVWVFAALVGAFLISRLAWILWNPVSAGYWEESYRWVVAHELLTGPSQPFIEYQADHYQGGSLVMSLLVVPFFKAFGESITTLKLAAMSYSSATLAMLYLVGRTFFGRATGVLAGLAYVAGPPLVAYWGLVVIGSHGESILFSLLQVYLFLGILTGKWRSPGAWAALGFTAGLGLWFCYTSGLTIAACGLTWLLLRRSIRWSEIRWALLGGLIGLVPWFFYNLQHSFMGGVRILELFGLRESVDKWVAQGAWDKLVSLVSHDLPVGLLFPLPLTLANPLRIAVMCAYGLPLIVALCFALRRVALVAGRTEASVSSEDAGGDSGQSRRELVFIVYGFVFLALFLISRFTVDRDLGIVSYRLFTPLVVLLTIPAAITAVGGPNRKVLFRRVAVAGCALVLMGSAAATMGLALRSPEGWQVLRLKRGYNVMGVLLHRKYHADLDEALRVAERICEPADRERVWRGIGWGMEHRMEKFGTIEELSRELSKMPLLPRARVVGGMLWGANSHAKQLENIIRRDGPDDRRKKLLARVRMIAEFAKAERKRLLALLPPRPDRREGSSVGGTAPDSGSARDRASHRGIP